ncbi:RNA 3'-terminal phosphate cyclase [archaeon HR06]|nr:RNA 3'-terminal phosphate cyclase [archaeon HR06]
MLRIDGSYGEGGGQILRTSLALSSLLKMPVEIYNIRSKRKNPGLRAQHIASIKAIAELYNAEVENLKEGSSFLRFYPRELKGEKVKINVGTAGSITLILQALIPSLSLVDKVIEVELIGGTDVKWSPTFNYFQKVALEAFKALGVYVNIKAERRGYYPRGGGIVKCFIKPNKIRNVEWVNFKEIKPSIISVCSNLPLSVAERQLKAAKEKLIKENLELEREEKLEEPALDKGSSLLVYSVKGEEGIFIGGDSIGEKGKLAEKVGEEAAEKFLKTYKIKAPLDEHIADMIVPFLFLANGPSKFLTCEATEHLKTNLYVAKLFIDRDYKLELDSSGRALISIF